MATLIGTVAAFVAFNNNFPVESATFLAKIYNYICVAWVHCTFTYVILHNTYRKWKMILSIFHPSFAVRSYQFPYIPNIQIFFNGLSCHSSNRSMSYLIYFLTMYSCRERGSVYLIFSRKSPKRKLTDHFSTTRTWIYRRQCVGTQ